MLDDGLKLTVDQLYPKLIEGKGSSNSELGSRTGNRKMVAPSSAPEVTTYSVSGY